MAAGVDVLIEKPLASTQAEANEMLLLAKKHNRIAQVGHLERFNPAVRATLPLAGTILLSDTRALPQSGGALETSLLNVSVPNLLSAQIAHASTIGHGDRSRSEASVANLALTVNGNSIGAAFLMSNATAVCGTRLGVVQWGAAAEA